MWPTVSYCCMSFFHRKGMNWRHSLTMKIVCIFLNWESSLRLHRVVLLHITWEGKYTFFCSNNNLLSSTTIYLPGSCIKKKLLQIVSQSGGAFQRVLHLQLSASETQAYLGEKEKSFAFSDTYHSVASVCFWLLSPRPPLFIKKKEKERENLWTFCYLVVMLWGLGKAALSRWKRYDKHRTLTIFLSDRESWNPTFYCNLSSHPYSRRLQVF